MIDTLDFDDFSEEERNRFVRDVEAAAGKIREQRQAAQPPKQPTAGELEAEIDTLERQLRRQLRTSGVTRSQIDELDSQLGQRMAQLSMLRGAGAAQAQDAKRAKLQGEIDALSAEYRSLARFPSANRSRLDKLGAQLDGLWAQLRELK